MTSVTRPPHIPHGLSGGCNIAPICLRPHNVRHPSKGTPITPPIRAKTTVIDAATMRPQCPEFYRGSLELKRETTGVANWGSSEG